MLLSRMYAAGGPLPATYCGQCGRPLSPGATSCSACGTPVGDASPSPLAQTTYYAPPISPPPTTIHMGLVLGIVGVVVVGLVLGVYVVYNLARTPTLPPTGGPKAIGVAVAKSADGTNWTLTFTSVPTGLSPATTYLTLMSSSGATLLPATSLGTMSGMMSMSGSSGMLYMQYQGSMMSTVSTGDMVRIGTTISGTGASTAGCQVQISIVGETLYSGTLQ